MPVRVWPSRPVFAYSGPRDSSQPVLSQNLSIKIITSGVILAFGALIACHYGLQTSAVLGHTMNSLARTLLSKIKLIQN